MLQGLMHHIVLQQRVTLDCALLSLAGLLARMTQKICTYSFNELVCSSYISCMLSYHMYALLYHMLVLESTE